MFALFSRGSNHNMALCVGNILVLISHCSVSECGLLEDRESVTLRERERECVSGPQEEVCYSNIIGEDRRLL